MDGIQMEPIGKYKADRNGSAKTAAWRNMVDQDLDDVAFLADTDKAREARELEAPVAVCSQRKALCLTALVFTAIFATALLVVYASPQPDCPCAGGSPLIPGQAPTEPETSVSSANNDYKDRIASNGAVFPWRGARLPTFMVPIHYSLWLHPNLTTGELRGEVSIDFRVDRDTGFLVLNVRDMNVTERALFKSGGSLGPKIVKTLDYPPADQTYIEFKEKLRRKFNYTLSLRFITKLGKGDKQRGFFLTGTHRRRCAVSRFWLTHARSAFPCLDEPHLRATFKLTIVRDRFHVSLTNMPIVATEEAGFYLGHRLLQDEFAQSPPISPHMISLAVCRLQRRAAPLNTSDVNPESEDVSTEISLYSDQETILNESGPLLEWVQRTIQLFSYELNTSYPLPKFDIVVVDGSNPYSEGWGLIILDPVTLTDTKIIAKLIAQQWFGGLVSPRWWSSQWLMEALTSVLSEKATPLSDATAEREEDALLLDHVLPALRLDSSYSVRAVANPRLERADIETTAEELSLHKGAAIVSMAIEAAGEAAGRAALARLLRDHRFSSTDARDLWRALQKNGTDETPAHAWDGWCDKAGYPLLSARISGPDVIIRQERFVMSAEPPDPEPVMMNSLLTMDLRADLDELFYEPENYTEIIEEDINATTTTPQPTTTTKRTTIKTTKAPPLPKWVIPVTFSVGPLENNDEEENVTRIWKNTTESIHNGTWYEISNDTKIHRISRWAENVTHLIWMNETEMVIPDLGKHKWVRYNVGARGLYRVAPQDHAAGETAEVLAQRAAELYDNGMPAERALLLDDAFILSRAGRLPASRAMAAAARLSNEHHWAPWRVVLTHLSWWKELLRLSASAPHLNRLLSQLHPDVQVYTQQQIETAGLTEDQLWLSGALLMAGVEWENENITNQALDLFDAWFERNETIPEIYQEAALVAGVRSRGAVAWHRVWRELLSQTSHSIRAAKLLPALAAPDDDWLFYRFAYTVLSSEAQRGRDWKTWATALCAGACKWRGAAGVWRVVSRAGALPPGALQAAARCLHHPTDYWRFKELFGEERGAAAALDTIALNSAWVPRADSDLLRYFKAVRTL
ncbi:thyrotropin-releasing hormone-degrading ectoenzyme [Papilio machaon]|uniref:thyrotropin-releasing hormone-degrading ectoenzyme n=1 Tax=Papilio machaon TaxID=76193 RepID=UPI001E664D45|nr:thyrotropin-releasing hormone-degrading ectoenzyme [Papilio machaon]